jgi:ribulose 1,5-bisphosphate synthetase/thiazole synthase
MRDPIDPHRGRQLAFHGYTVLIIEADGSIGEGSGLGLFDFDARILSKHRLLVDARVPVCDTSGLIDHDSWVAHLTVVTRAATRRPQR